MSADSRDVPRRRVGYLGAFGLAFLVLVASAVCLAIGNLRATNVALAEISMVLSVVAVTMTVVALLIRPPRP
ncbi:MAG TPA: hypothetical protein VEM41_08630 [Actinomycetota bacterium]|nr:hypothetical protein [Actinomycetota bacterium]